jgi:hypothetical protein
MADKLTRNLKMTIGGPEVTPGTAVAREFVIPLGAAPSLRAVPEKAEDPVITGVNMTRGQFTMAKDDGGSIPLAPRCVGGMGQLLNSLLGQEATPVQIGGCIRIRYTGGDASCKISANTSADTLDSDVGDLGSETGDTNFGTSGSIDLTAMGTDTIGELVTEIGGYTDYDCEKVFGADSVDAADIVDITEAQGADRWVYVFFSSSTSGYYLHSWEVDLTNTERPTYSVQADGMHDNYLHDGVMINEMSLSAALKAMVEGSCEALGFEEAGGQSASSLSLEDADPLIFSRGAFTLGEHEFNFLREVEITMSNNADPDGFGMGSLWRQYHRKAQFSLTGSASVRYDANIFGFRAGMFNDAVVGMSFYFRANTDFATDIPQIMIVDIPYAQLTSHQEEENNGVLDVGLELVGTNPDGEYSAPLSIHMITADSGAY